MAADILAEIFSDTRVKIMRLFLRNPQDAITTSEITERTYGDSVVVRSEVRTLAKIGFLQSAGSSAKPRVRSKVAPRGWMLNPCFELLRPLRTLVLKEVPVTNADLLKRFKIFGNRLKLAVLSGIFLDDESARADMLLVGDGISRTRLEKLLRSIEADFGRALNYVYFTTEEYEYRVKMYDRFLRDILALPHETLVDRFESKKS